MSNKKRAFYLLTTITLLLTSTVSVAQNTDWFDSDNEWEEDCWLDETEELICWEDDFDDTPTQQAPQPTQERVQQTPTNTTTTTNGNMAQEALDAHNRYRAEVGVPPLKWSDTLSNSSQQWADQLAATGTFQHSNAQGVGENIWMGTSNRYSITSMVDSWGSEKQFFTPGIFPDVSTTGNWSDVGHYTQMIWRDTTEVGCAVATGANNDYFVCQYSPAGNFQGQAVY